jgi:hypothetical protein
MSRPRNEARRAHLLANWPLNVRKYAEAEGTSAGAIYRMARGLGLPTQERKYPTTLSPKHKAIRGRSTKYPSTITSAKQSPRVFIAGSQNQKLGHIVNKGRWRGMYIYSLTLIERASCPTSCLEWSTCYGNSLHHSRRHILDRELFRRVDIELDMLAARHPKGFVVRLHVLGDFGKDQIEGLPYVELWREKMRELPNLHVFGFTAHDRESLLGRKIMFLNKAYPDRWRIRFSGTVSNDGFGATVIDSLDDAEHVPCPYEAGGRVKDCGACGLCWSMAKTVEFVRH